MISWLQQRSPDVWHIVANRLNWDCSLGVLEWIVTQPQCDLATAALLFWKGEPDDWLKYPSVSVVPPIHLENFNFIKRLADRANSGLYKRREIAFAGEAENLIEGVDQFLKLRAERMVHLFQQGTNGAFPWELPKLLIPPIPGRAPRVSSEEDPKQSVELQKLLFDLGTIIDKKQLPPRRRKVHPSEQAKLKRRRSTEA